MKPTLMLPIAVALLLAGSVISWWRVPHADTGAVDTRVSVGLLTTARCAGDEGYPTSCAFQDDGSQVGSARHWAFLVGVITAAALIALRAAPVGSRVRGALATAAMIGSATALTLRLGALCLLSYMMGAEAKLGYPGLGGPLFIAGAIVGLRTARITVAGEPPA